jgi:hypothetical protein
MVEENKDHTIPETEEIPGITALCLLVIGEGNQLVG